MASEKGPASLPAEGPDATISGRYLPSAVRTTPASARIAVGGTMVAALARGRMCSCRAASIQGAAAKSEPTSTTAAAPQAWVSRQPPTAPFVDGCGALDPLNHIQKLLRPDLREELPLRHNHVPCLVPNELQRFPQRLQNVRQRVGCPPPRRHARVKGRAGLEMVALRRSGSKWSRLLH